MAYAYQTAGGRTNYLHGKPVVLPNGRPLTVSSFAPAVKPREALKALPARPTRRLQRPA